MTFGDLGISDKLTIFSDGKNVVDHFKEILDDIANQAVVERKPIQPVSLLLLDINMPIKSGLEAIIDIKEKYRVVNEQHQNSDGLLVLKPLLCFYS